MSALITIETCRCDHLADEHFMDDDPSCWVDCCDCRQFAEDRCACGHDAETHHEVRGVWTAGLSHDGCAQCTCDGYEMAP